jgi:hypothetical protein
MEQYNDRATTLTGQHRTRFAGPSRSSGTMFRAVTPKASPVWRAERGLARKINPGQTPDFANKRLSLQQLRGQVEERTSSGLSLEIRLQELAPTRSWLGAVNRARFESRTPISMERVTLDPLRQNLSGVPPGAAPFSENLLRIGRLVVQSALTVKV